MGRRGGVKVDYFTRASNLTPAVLIGLSARTTQLLKPLLSLEENAQGLFTKQFCCRNLSADLVLEPAPTRKE